MNRQQIEAQPDKSIRSGTITLALIGMAIGILLGLNAQAESDAVKPTFKKAFEAQRCIVPCTGWYEWRSEGGPRKQKYAFTHTDDIPFLIAGIWFGEPANAELVTLTASPGKWCAEIRNRMPVLIDPENVALWLNASTSELGGILATNRDDHIAIE